MALKIFRYEEHAEEINRWGSRHGFPLPPKSFLPDIGFILNDTACGFFYTTNSKLAWIEWVFSNPDKTKEERTIALDGLMAIFAEVAQVQGIQAIFSSSKHEAFSQILERNQFILSDHNMSHYIRRLG